ncbi:hypothetical protein MMYC01_205178 [Madurella mycetomatis]|uniref:Myb-like domain-containing protein n=1 Tax=Madurella mycetomatis TaxID=100816 RepID=A0A175WDK9_9PEZI|nr:hypothetical protein MMYC01_205178 [Madurella mycetomatis]
MFISLTKPQVDVVFPRNNVFTSTAAAAYAPLLSGLNNIGAAQILHQHRLRGMSFNSVPLRNGLPGTGLKRQRQQHQVLPAYGSRCYSVETQEAGENAFLPVCYHACVPLFEAFWVVNKTDEEQIGTGNPAPLSANPLHVSPYTASRDSGMICQSSMANVTGTSGLFDPSYWQVVPEFSSFAPIGGDRAWEDAHQGRRVSTLDYGHYALGIHAGAAPQTTFDPSDVPRNSRAKAIPENGSVDYTDAESNLYPSSRSFSSAGTSDMLEAMAISNESSHPSWPVSPPETQAQYDISACVGPADPGQHHSDNNTWMPATTALGGTTVSPKMLRIRSTPTPTSSSESIRTSFLAGSADDNSPILCPNTENLPGRRSAGPARAVPKVKRLLPDRGQRQILPFHGSAGILLSNMPTRMSASRLDPSNPSPEKLGELKPKPRLGQPPLQLPAATNTLASSRLPELLTLTGREGAPLTSDGVNVDDRMSKDDFLVKHKQMGMTYKEIRRIGGFTEAESTLRGRYRTLTKSREARVRKPEWSEKDLRLLEKGVRELAHSPDLKTAKIPWKKVAEYIVNNGGSYHFGNSTCRKRWDELVREQATLGKVVWQPFYPQSPDQRQDVGERAGDTGYSLRSLDGYGSRV